MIMITIAHRREPAQPRPPTVGTSLPASSSGDKMSKEEGLGDRQDFTRAILHPLRTTKTFFFGESTREASPSFSMTLQYIPTNYPRLWSSSNARHVMHYQTHNSM
jgi:hypothetical protein